MPSFSLYAIKKGGDDENLTSMFPALERLHIHEQRACYQLPGLSEYGAFSWHIINWRQRSFQFQQSIVKDHNDGPCVPTMQFAR
jgi:hypothetical protein